ncbi:hypothetical protein NPIL_559571 [Nephila pilipes]|uniref:RNase H type-1 domain-containing protein n=1 Tax=Nephila pilipes TaxID=299642 RepID=A0A8X6U7V9_NEPPI|nr:hypothetical protein NPIL_559571 [Nephila pilipes]
MLKSTRFFLAVTNLQSRLGSFEKAIILVYSRSAIETIALQHLSESLIMSKIKQVIRELFMIGKIVEFQWIPSHVDIDGNKRADLLAKRGTKSHMEEIAIPLDSLKRCVREKIILNFNSDLSNKSRDKSEKILQMTGKNSVIDHVKRRWLISDQKLDMTAYYNIKRE